MINANDLDWGGLDTETPQVASEKHTESEEYPALGEGHQGILFDCYLCGRDLSRLDPRYIEKRKYNVEGANVKYHYVISYCLPCVKRFLT